MQCVLKDGVSLSPIALGCDYYGSRIPKERAFELLDTYVAQGGNVIDTANAYSLYVPGGEGVSERTIGTWMQARGNRMDLVLCTKGGFPPLEAMDKGRCSREELETDLTQSLDRLQTERIDLYWLHRDEITRPVEEIMGTLASFVAEGRIRHIGVSNWTLPRIEAANRYAAEQGLPAIIANQLRWSLADRVKNMPPPDYSLDVDEATWHWHHETQMPVFPFSAQAKGFFSAANVRWAREGFTGSPPLGDRYDAPHNHRRLQKAITLSKHHNCTANQIALAWLLHQPFPVCPIVGTSNPEHLEEALGAATLTLTSEQVAWLSDGPSVRPAGSESTCPESQSN